MIVLDWMLDADPSIRWQALRDLADAPAEVVAAERARGHRGVGVPVCWPGRATTACGREGRCYLRGGVIPMPPNPGLLMQLGGRRHRPWLSVDDRWLPMLRARRGHGRRERTRLGLATMVTSSTGVRSS
jgi:hypothetical protein